MVLAAAVAVAAVGLILADKPGSAPAGQSGLVQDVLSAQDASAVTSGSAASAEVLGGHGDQLGGLQPSSPGETARPAEPSVANSPPLRSHEVFGFAPYWTLPQEASFDVSGLSTIAYFSIGINADGSLDESGSGWQGYESQQFIDLIDRAHAAGDRVVITVNDFSQASLDHLTSSSAAARQLSLQVLDLVRSRQLDGVNLDLEGEGSGDQAGLTSLVATVATEMHQANPNYQVTMDTYASSAGDPSGFYDIASLSRYVDAFFVMAYELNLRASAGAASPLTSPMFSNQQAASQYARAVPASKVILGLPLFGYDWPTANGALGAGAQGGPAIVTYGQEQASGHPVYWDAVTDTAWTSYQVGRQWHQAFFEDPNSLYLAAQLADSEGLGGVGLWALGMDGVQDASVVQSAAGHAPPLKDTLAGPTQTSASGSPSETASLAAPQTSGGASSTTASPAAPTTPTTRPPTTTTVPYSYRGLWHGNPVTLTPGPGGTGGRTLVGTLSGFATTNPVFSCLAAEGSLRVYVFASDPVHDFVVARTPADCMDKVMMFIPPDGQGLPTTTTSTYWRDLHLDDGGRHVLRLTRLSLPRNLVRARTE